MLKPMVRPATLQRPGRVPGDNADPEKQDGINGRGPEASAAPTLAQPRAGYDAAQIQRAVYFTTVLFLGRGQYEREETGSLALAREAASRMTDHYGRRAMIYAVTPEGLTIHVE